MEAKDGEESRSVSLSWTHLDATPHGEGVGLCLLVAVFHLLPLVYAVATEGSDLLLVQRQQHALADAPLAGGNDLELLLVAGLPLGELAIRVRADDGRRQGLHRVPSRGFLRLIGVRTSLHDSRRGLVPGLSEGWGRGKGVLEEGGQG